MYICICIYIYTLLYAHNYTLNYTHILVGGFNPSEKYEHQLGLFFPIYMESHKIPWFQSTNQYSICGGFLKLGTRLDFHEHLMFNQTRCMYIYIYLYTYKKTHIDYTIPGPASSMVYWKFLENLENCWPLPVVFQRARGWQLQSTNRWHHRRPRY